MAFSLVIGLAHEKVHPDRMAIKSMARFICEIIMLIYFAKVLFFFEICSGLF